MQPAMLILSLLFQFDVLIVSMVRATVPSARLAVIKTASLHPPAQGGQALVPPSLPELCEAPSQIQPPINIKLNETALVSSEAEYKNYQPLNAPVVTVEEKEIVSENDEIQQDGSDSAVMTYIE